METGSLASCGGIMIKILSVEDDPQVITLRQAQLRKYGDDITLLPAKSVNEALELIGKHADIKVALLDGEVLGGGEAPNTRALLPALLELSDVLIIACSSSDDFNEKLLAEGAHEKCAKNDVPKRVEALLWQE